MSLNNFKSNLNEKVDEKSPTRARGIYILDKGLLILTITFILLVSLFITQNRDMKELKEYTKEVREDINVLRENQREMYNTLDNYRKELTDKADQNDKSITAYNSIELINYSIPVFTQEEKELLYRLVWKEAGIDDAEGQKAVTQVIINRLNSQYFPNTLKDIISQPKQFDGYKLINANTKPSQEVIESVDSVLSGDLLLDYDVVYYWLPRCVNQHSWFKQMHNDYFYKQIGLHYFYKQNEIEIMEV